MACDCRTTETTYTYGGELRTARVAYACAEHRDEARRRRASFLAWLDRAKNLGKRALPAPCAS